MRGFTRNAYQYSLPAKVGTVPMSIFVTLGVRRKWYRNELIVGQRFLWKEDPAGEIQTGRLTNTDPLRIDRV